MKINIKKVIALIMVFVFLGALVGCSDQKEDAEIEKTATVTIETKVPEVSVVVEEPEEEQDNLDELIQQSKDAEKAKEVEKINDSKLTLEKFKTIENGMTYEEVINIIGFDGELEVELGEKGTDYHTISYRYMEEKVKGSLGANASFTFQGGKLSMKVQMGLE